MSVPVPIIRFALKMLLHEPGKTLGGVCGVAFGVCLCLIQVGLYHGALVSMSIVIDESSADLWVVSRGSPNFDCMTPLPERQAYRVQSFPGVERVEPAVVMFVWWRLANGGVQSVEVIGLPADGEMLRPWNVCVGETEPVFRDRNVIIDESDLRKLQCSGLGYETEIYAVPSTGMQARVVGLTRKNRTFISTPLVLTSIQNARAFGHLGANDSNALMVRTTPGADPGRVKQALNEALPDMEAFTREEFASLTQTYWNTNTGVGVVLFAFAVLGAIIAVGTVSMIQYISAMDHLKEYAILKALGTPNHRVIGLVAAQSVIIGVLGYGLGLGLTRVACQLLENLSIPIQVQSRGDIFLWSFCATLLFCVLASVIPAVKIIRTDPEVVFRT